MGGKGLQAMAQQRLARQRQELFRQFAAQAQSASGGHDQCYDIRHSGTSMEAQTSQAATICQAARFAKAVCQRGWITIMRAHANQSHPPTGRPGGHAALDRRCRRRAVGAGISLLWLLLAAALAGPAGLVVSQISAGWQPGLSANLWASVAVDLAGFSAALCRGAAGRLSPRAPCCCLTWPERRAGDRLLQCAQCGRTGRRPSDPWFVAPCGAGGGELRDPDPGGDRRDGVLLQERALKRRAHLGWAGRTLPPLAEAEGMQIRLLTWSAVLMAAALATGAANEVIETGQLLAFTHKILLAFLAFALIVALLLLHHRTGLRGRHAARWLLVGYLLLLLAYPGVKFVKDVLIG